MQKGTLSMICKATKKDLDAIVQIYDHIHAKEDAGDAHTGWLTEIYPVRATAEAALARDDLFVYRDVEDRVLGTAIINRTQVDSYAVGHWAEDAPDDQVMVLHTLVVEPAAAGQGIGRTFVEFYQQYAKENGCPYLRIDTNAINAPARAMYHKLGFREADIVPCTFNGIPNVQLVLLEKKLC